MQWHEMEWPVMWDPFNLLGLSVVPVTFLLDSDGTIRLVQPLLERIDDIAGLIIGVPWDREAGSDPSRRSMLPDLDYLPPRREEAKPMEWSNHAVSLALWGGPQRLDQAVGAAQRATEARQDPTAWFRLGVLLRMRYDSIFRQAGDFGGAVAAWTRALNADPNNYIWRRRLQQYGPRLAKPYSFYDWVPEARSAITSRGETPLELAVEPQGAELAKPATVVAGEGADLPQVEPDPNERILVDDRPLIRLETVLVPPVVRAGEATRVHLLFMPDPELDGHWNNEVGPGEIWLTPPPGWHIDGRYHVLEPGPDEVSDEVRHVEFEAVIPVEAEAGVHTISGYALYYVCQGETGACLYRRRALTVPIEVAPSDLVEGLPG